MSARIHILGEEGEIERSISSISELALLCKGRTELIARREIANDHRMGPKDLVQVDVEKTARNAGYECRQATIADQFAQLGDWIWWAEFEG